MSKTRTIHFDATRAFVFSVLSVGVLGAAFAGGFRLGQEMPVQVDVSYEPTGAAGPDHVESLVAPAQRVPAETYTFYEHTRTIEREAPAPGEEPPVRVLDREPSPAPAVVAEPSEDREAGDAAAPAGAAGPGGPVEPARPTRTVIYVAPPSSAPVPRDLGGPAPGGDGAAEPVAEPTSDPGAIERTARIAGDAPSEP